MNSTSSERKLFTLEEARKSLPLVRAIVSDIVRQARDVSERQDRLRRIAQLHGPPVPSEDGPNPYQEEVLQIEEELQRDEAKLQEYVKELQDLGVELKDFERGLVDFPHEMEGRVVYLCWQLDEEDVNFWHELDAGFTGRQSLLEGSITAEDSTDAPESAG